MSIQSFKRLISDATTIYLGLDREQAAINAANATGNPPTNVTQISTWPILKKFDNDAKIGGSPSPFSNVTDPSYVWQLPVSSGQSLACAAATDSLDVSSSSAASFAVYLAAFSDNAMTAKIELFEYNGSSFVKTAPQPNGLLDFIAISGEPSNPAMGLTETPPYNWQSIRIYSTHFEIPIPGNSSTFKIVVSFEVTNYNVNPIDAPNPAALQFILDTYYMEQSNGG